MVQSILPGVWEVPEVFRRRLGTKVGRQREMFADGHLLLVLHAPPQPGDDHRTGRFFWRKPDGTWMTSEEGNGVAGLDRHLTEYAEIVDRLEAKETTTNTADGYFDLLEKLAPVHRAARNLHQVLQKARKEVPEDRLLIDLRDRAYDVERSAELLYQGLQNALDFAVVKRAEEQAQASHKMAVAAHRLNVLAAFFFPIATLSSIFGVNLYLGHLDRYESYLPLVLLIGGGLVAGFTLQMIIRRP